MKNTFALRACALACVSLIIVATVGTTVAQVKKGKTRLMLTKHLMQGVVKPHCTNLKKGLDAGPSNDEAWEELALHASLLNEGSFSLMADGRCPDGVWADAASKTLRQGSENVIKAIDAKDLEAAKKAFGAMTKSCKACHDKHKKND